MDKLWYILTKAYHLIKRNELLTHTTWMNLKNTVIWKKPYTKELIVYTNSVIWNAREDNSDLQCQKETTACLRLSLGRNGWDGKMEFFTVIQTLSMLILMVVIQVYKFAQSHKKGALYCVIITLQKSWWRKNPYHRLWILMWSGTQLPLIIYCLPLLCAP